MENIDQGFGLAEAKQEGADYKRYSGYAPESTEQIEVTQADYMHKDNHYPTVAEMIEILSTMPKDAKVCYYYDSHIHGSIDMIYESKGGAVILTTNDEMYSMREFAKPKDIFHQLNTESSI